MNLQRFMIINAILFVPFGLVMLAVPGLFFPLVGVDLDADGILMARVSGSALMSFGVMCYMVRTEANGSMVFKALLVGNLIFHALDAFSTGLASYNGTMNSLGWFFCGLHFVLALGFAYYLKGHRYKA